MQTEEYASAFANVNNKIEPESTIANRLVVRFQSVTSRPVFHRELGEFFRDLRLAKGWKQSQAVDIAARRELSPPITRQVLLLLEAGRIRHPRPAVVNALSSLYDYPREEMKRRVVSAIAALAFKEAGPNERAVMSAAATELKGSLNEITDQLREFTSGGGASPSDDPHGTHCAGVLAFPSNPRIPELLAAFEQLSPELQDRFVLLLRGVAAELHGGAPVVTRATGAAALSHRRPSRRR